MFAGISVALDQLPVDWVERHHLARRVRDRGGERDVAFLLADAEPMFPVWIDGTLRLARWGYRRGESRRMPCTPWTWRKTLETGGWNKFDGVEVVIPASLGFDRGVWFLITEGIRGVTVRDGGEVVVYVVVEPSTHYYQVMTRSPWMASLVRELI